MKQYKSLLKKYFIFLKENFLLFFLLLLIVTVLTLVKPNGRFLAYDVDLSLADSFIFLSFGLQFYCNTVLIPAFFLCLLTKRDFSINNLLRSRGVPFLWYEHVFLAFVNLMFFTFFQVLLVFTLVLPNTTSFINFEDRHSYLAFVTNGKTVFGVDFCQVFFAVLLFLILAGMVLSMLFLFFEWMFHNLLWPFVLILLISFFDMSDVFGVCTNFGVDHSKWIDFNPTWSILLLLLIVLIFTIGRFFSLRKEFFSC